MSSLISRERAYDVVILRRNDFTIDGRVERQASSLGGRGLRVLVLAQGGGPLPAFERRPGFDLRRVAVSMEDGLLSATPAVFSSLVGSSRWIQTLGVKAGTAAFYAQAARTILSSRPQVVHCHDVDTLVPGVVAGRAVGARVLYDSAELWTERNHGLSGWRRRFDRERYAAVEGSLIHGAAATVTVSEGIADELRRRYGIPRPVVVRNVPRRPPPEVGGEGVERHVGGAGPVILHLGIVDPNRGLEQAVQAVARIPEAHLVLMGTARPPVLAELRELARREGLGERLVHVPPAERDRIIAEARGADVGLCTFQPNCLSHVLAMPNKLFEYAFAGVPIVASDFPDMSQFVRSRGLGVVCDTQDPRALFEAIRSVLDGEVEPPEPDVTQGVIEELHWDREFERLWALYEPWVSGGLRREAS